ncbi:MAG: Asp/Glu/hydantoin racemase [Pseudomonas sp.]|jgi:allantoin racemase|uniref:aspartate/glutamate racemase family protein n=1 Tax=Pseudomonas sp. TaxID=306 RepID=UPI002637FA8C|nr:aspartate/glutamate racemase family protein [Pseudomonas sp.]MDB6047637.1 Asp/Glu/hydantoin racemase [Pseudomonas sp.]
MRIQVINPNTSQAMTHKIGVAAQAVARAGTEIFPCCPQDGPESIEGHFDEAIAAVGLLEEIRKGVAHGYDAHVIACFGDPGLLAARELAIGPVIGIAEAAFHLASLVSTRFAVITTLGRTRIIAEHLLQRYGMQGLCTSVSCLEIPVLALEACDDALIERIAVEGRRLRDEEGAGAIVLGCGGMADLRQVLSEAIGIPVVEGVSAAVKLAESLVELGLGTSKHGDLAFPLGKGFTGRYAHLSR